MKQIIIFTQYTLLRLKASPSSFPWWPTKQARAPHSSPEYTVTFVGRAPLLCTSHLVAHTPQPGHILPWRRSLLQRCPSSPQPQSFRSSLLLAWCKENPMELTSSTCPGRTQPGCTWRPETPAQLPKKILVTEMWPTVEGSQLPGHVLSLHSWGICSCCASRLPTFLTHSGEKNCSLLRNRGSSLQVKPTAAPARFAAGQYTGECGAPSLPTLCTLCSEVSACGLEDSFYSHGLFKLLHGGCQLVPISINHIYYLLGYQMSIPTGREQHLRWQLWQWGNWPLGNWTENQELLTSPSRSPHEVVLLTTGLGYKVWRKEYDHSWKMGAKSSNSAGSAELRATPYCPVHSLLAVLCGGEDSWHLYQVSYLLDAPNSCQCPQMDASC